MPAGLIVVAIVIGASIIAATLALRPTGFDRCLSITMAAIERDATPGATLDPRDVEAQAARICAGAA